MQINKFKLCVCGCNNRIIEKPFHKYTNVRYINGHFAKDKINSIESRKKSIATILRRYRNKEITVWNKGLKLSDEIRKKMSITNKGKRTIILNFNEEQEQILLGSLLGDGCISYSLIGNCHHYKYQEPHCIEQKEYILWKNSYLRFNIYISKKQNQHLIAKESQSLKEHRNLFYPNGKKIVTTEILNKLELLGLATWFMDDGCYLYHGNFSKLATHSFGLEGNQIIQKWFKERWDIDCKIRATEKYYFLWFNIENTKKLITLIKSYVLQIPCMYYKVGVKDGKD